MKLYIESYQSKIEELEPLEERSEDLKSQMLKIEDNNKRLQSEIEELKNIHKEKKAEWRLREQEFKNLINKNQTKQHYLESKVKDLETIIKTNRTFSGSAEKERSAKTFTNQLEARSNKGDLILLKDESFKMHSDNKIKYMLKNIPGGSVKASDDPEDAFISFSELSTKTPDKSKIGSMKKSNPYKIEYFKHNPDRFENPKNDIKINRNGRINVNPNYSRANYNNSEVEDKHKRSKSQSMNTIKSKKVSKSSDEQPISKEAYMKNMMNDYLENPKKVVDIMYKNNSNLTSYSENHKRQSSKRSGWYIKKNFVNIQGPEGKKKSFKSFDQRRAFTRLDHRENSLENPVNDSYLALNQNPLRSSSA